MYFAGTSARFKEDLPRLRRQRTHDVGECIQPDDLPQVAPTNQLQPEQCTNITPQAYLRAPKPSINPSIKSWEEKQAGQSWSKVTMILAVSFIVIVFPGRSTVWTVMTVPAMTQRKSWTPSSLNRTDLEIIFRNGEDRRHLSCLVQVVIFRAVWLLSSWGIEQISKSEALLSFFDYIFLSPCWVHNWQWIHC